MYAFFWVHMLRCFDAAVAILSLPATDSCASPRLTVAKLTGANAGLSHCLDVVLDHTLSHSSADIAGLE